MVLENQIRVVSVGKIRTVSRFLHGYPYLSIQLHLGKSLERKKDHSMYGLALKYKAFSDMNELGMDLVSGAFE